MLTTEFKRLHNLSDRQFNTIHRKVREAFLTSHPDLQSDPTCDLTQVVVARQGSTQWVILYPELFEAELLNVKTRSTASKQDESIQGEIVETHPLPNGSSLVFRSEAAPVPYVPPIEIKTEAKRIDFSGVDLLLDQLRSDIDSKRETEQLTKLVEFAQGCEAEKKQRDLVEMLISQGYTAEQAITIAQGAKNLTPVGK